MFSMGDSSSSASTATSTTSSSTNGSNSNDTLTAEQRMVFAYQQLMSSLQTLGDYGNASTSTAALSIAA